VDFFGRLVLSILFPGTKTFSVAGSANSEARLFRLFKPFYAVGDCKIIASRRPAKVGLF